ncbi:hypothetical protein ABK040_006234 [Willaertia magna]
MRSIRSFDFLLSKSAQLCAGQRFSNVVLVNGIFHLQRNLLPLKTLDEYGNTRYYGLFVSETGHKVDYLIGENKKKFKVKPKDIIYEGSEIVLVEITKQVNKAFNNIFTALLLSKSYNLREPMFYTHLKQGVLHYLPNKHDNKSFSVSEQVDLKGCVKRREYNCNSNPNKGSFKIIDSFTDFENNLFGVTYVVTRAGEKRKTQINLAEFVRNRIESGEMPDLLNQCIVRHDRDR